MLRRLALTLTAVGLALALTAAPAAAGGGTLDQQQTAANNNPPIVDVIFQAQVFTAGLTGQLDQVDVLVSRNVGLDGGPATGLTVEIWTVTAGAPDSPVPGASATVLEADVPASIQTWVSVPINAPSVAGTQYAIVLSAPAATNFCPIDCWVWWADDAGSYSAGLGYFSGDSGANWTASGNQDKAFRTYVAVPPAPPASSLPDAAMAPAATTGSPLLALAFALLLIGSLGTLALANVRRR